MIPRLAHVFWVGGAPMPKKEAQCLERNAEVFGGYELVLWGDEDLPMLCASQPEIARFMDHAREHRKWAFMADAMKMLVLARFGGWAFDADNEFLQPPDAYARLHWVSGFENWRGLHSPITAVMGAVPGHAFTHALLAVYARSAPERMCGVPNTRWISDTLYQHGMNRDNRRQYVEALDVEIFPDHVFCGPRIDGQTVALHHFSGSWVTA